MKLEIFGYEISILKVVPEEQLIWVEDPDSHPWESFEVDEISEQIVAKL